jgi:sec-independent protein translocase protein TatA
MNIPLITFGSTEWIALIVLALLLFGGKKIPELMRGLGRGMREFNEAKNNVKDELESGINDNKKD